MPRNTSGLKRTAGPGRPKGSPNKHTQATEAAWEQFIGSEAYFENAKYRIIQGKAPHVESYWIHKTHGPEATRLELTGKDGGPMRWHDHFQLPAPPAPLKPKK